MGAVAKNEDLDVQLKRGQRQSLLIFAKWIFKVQQKRLKNRQYANLRVEAMLTSALKQAKCRMTKEESALVDSWHRTRNTKKYFLKNKMRKEFHQRLVNEKADATERERRLNQNGVDNVRPAHDSTYDNELAEKKRCNQLPEELAELAEFMEGLNAFKAYSRD